MSRTIAKDPRKLRLAPNVPDYEAWRREPAWEKAAGLLDWFEKGRSLNACHETNPPETVG